MGVTGGDAPAPVVAPILRELSVSPFLQGVLFGISAGLLLLGSFILRPFSFGRFGAGATGYIGGTQGGCWGGKAATRRAGSRGSAKNWLLFMKAVQKKKKAVLGQPKPCFPYETPLACSVETCNLLCSFWAFPPYFYARFYFSWLLEASYFSPPFKRKLQVGRQGQFGG